MLVEGVVACRRCSCLIFMGPKSPSRLVRVPKRNLICSIEIKNQIKRKKLVNINLCGRSKWQGFERKESISDWKLCGPLSEGGGEFN